jgi:hypothetical protein
VRRAWRPLALVLVVTGALPLVGATRGGAVDAPEPATAPTPTRSELIGSASARVAAAGPILAGLSLEAGFATSTVELVGQATRGESTTMSAGAANLFLAQGGAPPLVPEPTRADSSGTPDAERSVAAPAGDFVRVGHERAHAEPGRSEAVTRLGDLLFGPAASVVGGSSFAGIGEDGARSSSAVGELRLGEAPVPEVRLSQLVWQAAQVKGAPGEAGFSLGSASIDGRPLAVASPEQIVSAFEAINAVLGPQGIRLQAPVVTTAAEGGHVGPLRIELRDPPLNRALAGTAYSPLAPTVNQAQESAAKAAGDPRFDQALLGANLALALVLGNGGAAVELGGAMVGLSQREVPDLGSLFGGTSPLPDSADAVPGPAANGFGDGNAASDAAADTNGASFEAPTSFGVPAPGAYGNPAGPDATLPPESGGSAGAPPQGEVALGADATPGQAPDRRLPAPLAATALAAGLMIAGVDWLARRRTIGLVAGLRSAAGLAAAVGRPARSRRSLVAAGVTAVAVLGVALAPSRVPISAGRGDEVAIGSPIPAVGAGPEVETGVPTEAAAAVPGGTAPDAGAGAGGVPAGGPSGQGTGGRTAAGASGGNAKGPGAGNAAGNRPGTTGSTAAAGPGGRQPGADGAATPGAVSRGRDCPGGELQDRNSTYSPPCLKFSGDNGGATSKGVNAGTITVAMREPETFDAGVNKQGQITDTPADLKRTILAYVDYFNRVYQTYGRKVEVVFYKPKVPLFAGVEGGYQEEANADALTVGQQIKAFVDLTASAPAYADALVRQAVVGFGTYHMSKSWYQARAPWAWASLPDCTWIAEQSIDYLVKRLGNSPAKFAGDPAMRGKPRAIGLVVPDSPWYQECANHAESLYQAAGYRFARRVNYPLNFNQTSQTATNVVAQMKAAGVTTVMCMCDPLLPYFATPQANQQNYHPEWLVAGFGATDTDIVGQFYEQAQWSHAFGMGVVGELRSGYDSESYRAYKAVRTDEPAQLRDISYYPILWLFSCLQMAGPTLTPKTLEAGCFALGPRQGELGMIKFGPGDYTGVSDAREIYWDPQGTSPWNGRKGRYMATLGGQRFSGPWPQGEPAFPPPK